MEASWVSRARVGWGRFSQRNSVKLVEVSCRPRFGSVRFFMARVRFFTRKVGKEVEREEKRGDAGRDTSPQSQPQFDSSNKTSLRPNKKKNGI